MSSSPLHAFSSTLTLALAVLGWGALLVFFTVRIVRFVLGSAPDRAFGAIVSRVLAFICLVALYVFSPAGLMLVVDIAFGLLLGRSIDLIACFYRWASLAVGAASIILTIVLLRRAAHSARTHRLASPEDES